MIRTLKTIAGLIITGLVLLSLSACTPMLTSGEKQDVRIYLLEGQPSLALAKPKLNPDGPTITLDSTASAPGFAGSQMIYIEEAHRLDAFAYHRWADSPASMLQSLLVQTLESSGLFSRVFSGTAGVRSDLRLRSEVLRLQQSFLDENSVVELAVRFTLIDAGRRGPKPVSRVILVSEPAPEDSPYGGVVAANLAVNRLLDELQVFLVGALNSRR